MLPFQEKNDLLEELFKNKSDVFPTNVYEGSMHMDLNGNIFVFLKNSWAVVEDIKFEYTDEQILETQKWVDFINEDFYTKKYKL